MNSLFSILLKVSLSLAVFYGVYLLFLRKETFFGMNRFYLIFAVLISSVLPLFPVHYGIAIQPESEMKMVSALAESFQPFSGLELDGSSATGLSDVFLIIYLTGICLFFVRLMIQTTVIIHLIFKSKIRRIDGLRIVENEKYGLPFSFFKLIFINPKFHKQADLNDILSHERVHIDQNHWVDLLIIELLTVIFWFNPFIWLFERSIKQNHEYLADRGVLTRGLDLSRYQALLINQLMGMQIVGVTNNLNFALNTNRLKMMTKMQSKKIRSIKLIIALPVLFLLMAAFAEPSYIPVQAEIKPDRLSSMPVSTEKILVKGTVKDENGESLPGASIILKGTTIGTVTDIDGKYALEVPKDEKAIVVISFVGFITEEVSVPASSKGEAITETVLKRGQIFIETKDAEQILMSPPPPPPPPPVSAGMKEKSEGNVFMVVEELPSYPGGHYALMKYYHDMQKKLKEKILSEGLKAEGRALIGFTVNGKGKVANIKVLKKENDAVAKAAITLVENMNDWNPGKQRGKNVPVDYRMSFDFN